MAPAGDDVMVAAELLAAHDKLIDAVQVTAVLQRLGISADVDLVRGMLNALAAEQPPRLVRSTRLVGDGPGELIFYFVVPTRVGDDHS
jgi:hypothetical protein